MQDIELHKTQDDWNDGDLSEEDMVMTSKVMGSAMGNALRQATDLSGNNAAEIVVEDIWLGGGEEMLKTELLLLSTQEEQQLKQDFEWFQKHFADYGSLMGMTR